MRPPGLKSLGAGCLGRQQSVAVLIVALCFFAARSQAVTNDFFARGMSAQSAGDFVVAAALFESGLKQQPSVGAYVNLGITQWQGGHAGTAILAWERAAWISPYDAQAVQNLAFARTVAQVDAPELRWFETASTWLPPNSWVWIAGVSLWLAVGALVLPRVFRWRKSGWQQSVAALALGVFLFSLTASVGVVSRTNIGFILKKNAPLRLMPTSGSELISTLSAGEPVRREKTRGNYYFIRTSMAAGWIARDQVGLINE